jgi:hypothetical protein
MWYSPSTMKHIMILMLSLGGLWGCATTQVSREATLLSGLQHYNSEIQSYGGQISRWPSRQQAAGDLKTVVTATVGASPEFYRLIDLDLRKTEFIVTMRENALKPDRLKEMKDELVYMDDEIAALKPVIKTQLNAISQYGRPQQVEDIAALGLLGIALDDFSSRGAGHGGEAPATRVGQYTVTDLGSFATVRAADGKMFRCSVLSVPDEGSSVRCGPAN